MNKIASLIGGGFLAFCTNSIAQWVPSLDVFVIVMVVDYISGILAAKKEAYEHPDDLSFGLDSKKGILGIIKKFGYMLIVALAFVIDYILAEGAENLGWNASPKMLFGWVTIVWLILNELLSIIENLGRMGVPIPSYLTKIVANLKKGIDQKAADNIKNDE